MKKSVYSCFDKKAQRFGPLFCFQQDGEAMRDFDKVVNDPRGNQIKEYPEDFALYKLGTVDEETGFLEGLVPHVLLAEATAFVKVKKEN